ncbi:MAG: cellulase family glycosylhydrolase [Candidatus Hydrogenedentota bacterium]
MFRPSSISSIGAALALGVFMPAFTAASGVPQERFERLTQGINTSHWFAQTGSLTEEHFRSHMTNADFDAIERLGFQHVRLPVEPGPMFDSEDPESLPDDYLAHLDWAIEEFLERDIAVIVEIHTSGEFVERLEEDDAHVENVAAFWRGFAAHLSQYDPDWLFLELLNEPRVSNAERWNWVVRELASAAREGAQEHTIVVSGHGWSNDLRLMELEPLDDPNLVYNFHFYTPHSFTHQGASWGADFWPELRHMPFPSTPENIQDSLEATDDERAESIVRHYGEERWDEERLRERIAEVAAWGEEHGLRLTCNEFGIYHARVPREDGLRWLTAVREAFEDHGIGWAMWDYRGGFRVVEHENGAVTPDEGVLEALGLINWAMWDYRGGFRPGRGDNGALSLGEEAPRR